MLVTDPKSRGSIVIFDSPDWENLYTATVYFTRSIICDWGTNREGVLQLVERCGQLGETNEESVNRGRRRSNDCSTEVYALQSTKVILPYRYSVA